MFSVKTIPRHAAQIVDDDDPNDDSSQVIVDDDDTDDDSSMETKGSTTSSILSTITGKRKKPEKGSAKAPAPKHTPAASSWFYIELARKPKTFQTLTNLSLFQFNALYARCSIDPTWKLRENGIEDLPIRNNKLLAACLLLNKHSQVEIAKKMNCSSETVNFISQHLCPIAKKILTSLNTGVKAPPPKNIVHTPLREREYLFDAETGQYYTPLSEDENKKPRIRLGETLKKAMPPNLSEVKFTYNREKARVYFIIPEELSSEKNPTMIFRDILNAINRGQEPKKKTLSTKATQNKLPAPLPVVGVKKFSLFRPVNIDRSSKILIKVENKMKI